MALPRLLAGLVDEWELTRDGDVRPGGRSLVLPVRTAGGRPAALKVSTPADDNAHEHLALQHWHGRGAVQLLRADPRRRALLLERLHDEDLTGAWDIEACEVVAGLYPRLHVPAPPQLRPLAAYVGPRSDALAGLPRDAPLPRRLVEQAVSAASSLLADSASAGTTVHGDLHYGSVLAADREPWLAISPRPLSGDRHYEVAPLLWHRWDEVVSSGRVRETVRQRFLSVVDAAGLDEHRARDWAVVRAVLEAYATVTEASTRGGRLGDEDRDRLTTMVTVAKAVQE